MSRAFVTGYFLDWDISNLWQFSFENQLMNHLKKQVSPDKAANQDKI